MVEKFLSKTEFTSYEDFINNYSVNVPENFNFAFDVVDEYAKNDPEKKAIVWSNEFGEERTFTFADIKHYSNKTANYFKSLGIKKGDPVMLILKRRYEFWFCILALHRLGAVGIPATHLLTKKDIEYRNNAASIKMIVSTDDEEVLQHVDEAPADSPTLKTKVCLFGKREGWRTFHDEFESFSDVFERPTGSEDVTTKIRCSFILHPVQQVCPNGTA